MYRRYAPKQNNAPVKPEAQALTDSGNTFRTQHGGLHGNSTYSSRTSAVGRGGMPPSANAPDLKNPAEGLHKPKHKDKTQGFLAGLVPPSLYNRETKKLFGILSAEDLLILALIFILVGNDADDDSDTNDDTLLIFALIYLLISDYTELPF